MRPTATLTKTDRLAHGTRSRGDGLPYFDYLHVEQFSSGSASFVQANLLGREGTDDQRNWVEKRFWYLNRFSSREYSYFASPMSMEICNQLTQVRMVLSREEPCACQGALSFWWEQSTRLLGTQPSSGVAPGAR